ncbi:MAG: trypsin-like peptidase domain-containing protein [Caldilineaceae bacterium]|nr:trypsin-like peptidase domain-containing protein [Caldilineaceae bacterium]MBP8109459.1 trypsin-like peptidase domain-containing protein [Caldilineaceae bacterium]MBP8123651.1 trypsin-like peptidase domain-containing protein [Caldilineaceae bacterium]MBP9073091.1 trypsin-like peptidase domain-containing protein [Caldilineaceae bacterium]
MASQGRELPERDVIANVMQSVVQIVALKKGLLGNMSSLWTGSGTIVHPSGIILTNCHVANPRAMGMSSPDADGLAIAITQSSDEPPAITYFAEILVQVPELDIAVLRITTELNGRAAKSLKLPFVPIGDSDDLELGDTISIFGYPGIGGETVTFTSGSVSGFSHEKGISDRRAWIKTDATIAGGNSGGTAVNREGKLMGIPTQAAAGAGVTPVDARPVVDTNRDGRIDERDTPMAIGGFINGLRPVNLAKPLLTKAGMSAPTASSRSSSSQSSSSRTAPASAPAPAPAPVTPVKPAASNAVIFKNFTFSGQVTKDGRPIAPAAILPSGGKQIFASFDYEGMRNGTAWSQVWAANGQIIVSKEEKWSDGPRGRKVIFISNNAGVPDATYRVILSVRNQVVAEGEVVVGRRVDDSDTEISGSVVDQKSGRGIGDALIIALKPGVKAQDFVRKQDQSMAYTYARSDAHGSFTFPKQLPKGQAYSLIIVARGYQDLAVESALRISANAPEQATLSPIPLS